MTAAQEWENQLERRKRKEQREAKREKLSNGRRKQNNQTESSLEKIFKSYEQLRVDVLAYVTKLERVDVELPTLKKKREKKVKAAQKMTEAVDKLFETIQNCAREGECAKKKRKKLKSEQKLTAAVEKLWTTIKNCEQY